MSKEQKYIVIQTHEETVILEDEEIKFALNRP